MGINYCGKTDIGKKRETNQDFFQILELSDGLVLLVVCDGIGGAAGGSVASSLACESFVSYVQRHIENDKKDEYPAVLEAALANANENVCARAKSEKELSGMGTTLVCALYDGEDYYCLWIGDSRIYAVTKSGLLQISHDHSYVQTLVDGGNITREEAKNHPNRNIITKAVGTEAVILPDVCKMSASEMEGILLCSDGLCGYVDEDKIFDICKNGNEPEEACGLLVDAANAAGGPDNITVIVHNNR